jgi:hypothetical protein
LAVFKTAAFNRSATTPGRETFSGIDAYATLSNPYLNLIDSAPLVGKFVGRPAENVLTARRAEWYLYPRV